MLPSIYSIVKPRESVRILCGTREMCVETLGIIKVIYIGELSSTKIPETTTGEFTNTDVLIPVNSVKSLKQPTTFRFAFHNAYDGYLSTKDSNVCQADQSIIEPKFIKNISEQHPRSNTTSDNEEPSAELPEPSTKRKKEPKLKPKVFYCKFCGRRFKERDIFESHVKAHEGEKLFTCHVCGKQFGQTGSLYYHLKHVHEGVKNHACDICGRCFAMKSAMQDHRRIHTGERPYICDVCGKTYKTKAALYIHSKTHSDQFPYECSYCGKLFKFKQQMIGHMTMHTGIKNHRCDICGRSFGVKYELTRHLRVHSTEKPFTCGQCGLNFAQKRYLRSHERIKHKME